MSESQDGVSEASSHAYMQTLQMNIQRMSQLSNGCKTWCVTIVSALLLFAVKEELPQMVVVLLLPTALFYFLDAYYLSVEREFVSLYNGYVGKVHAGTAEPTDLYVVRLEGRFLARLGMVVRVAVLSFATLPFYGAMALVAILVWMFAF